MTRSSEKPDFIVDQYGTVKDVRHLKHEKELPVKISSIKSPNSYKGRFEKFKSLYRGKGRIYLYVFLVVFVSSIAVFLISNILTRQQSQKNANYLFNEAESYFDLGEYNLAISYYDKAILINPNFGEAYNNRGLANHVLGNFDSALADFNKALEIFPDSASVFSNRGLAYLYKADYQKAILDFNKAIQLQADFSNAFYNRGLAYYNLGNYDNAIADFDMAIIYSDNESPFFTTQPVLDRKKNN